jgi:hypothetical protein
MSRRIIAERVADGMALSRANIYFTAHDDEVAFVFRTAQSATPGQEVELYQEAGSRFGDVVFADVGGTFYGYFFALAKGQTTIKRIQLGLDYTQDPQVADVIGSPIADIDIVSGRGNLVTDGSFLYWQTDTAINKMPIEGGPVTNLDTTALTRPVAGLYLLGPNLIYAVDRTVYYVPADGSATTIPALRELYTADAGVVAFASLDDIAGDFIYVADRNGGIVVHSGSSTNVIQVPGTAFITSMAGPYAWTQMAMYEIAPDLAPAAWQLHLSQGVNVYTFATGPNPRLARYADSGNVFWLDDDGVNTDDL